MASAVQYIVKNVFIAHGVDLSYYYTIGWLTSIAHIIMADV